MLSFRRIFRRLQLKFFAWLVALCCCHAQIQPAASHVISGSVRDPSDAAIVGAQVDLTLYDGRIVSQTTTDGAGSFRFQGMSAGSYKIEAQHEGFRLTTVAVKVTDRQQATLKIVLAIAVAQQEVTVAGAEAVPLVSSDVAENQNANAIERSALDEIPVFDEDYITTLSRFLDSSALGTNGVSLVVNGVEANGPGVTNSAVKSIKINQNPYSALYSRPGRARIEIETKGGTQQYHGEVNVMFRDAVFDARNAFATVKPPERRQYYEGSVTGPLGSKKTTFLASIDEDRDDQQAFVVAQNLSGAVHANVPTPSEHLFASGRIFHDIGANDSFWIGYSYEQNSRKNQGVGGNVLPEAGTNLFNVEHEVNVDYRKVLSPRLLNQFHFLVGHQDTPVTSITQAPSIVVQGAFTGGGAQADSKRTEAHTEGNDIVTYDRGKHDLKFGVEIPDWSRRGADDFTNFLGTYSFPSLTDYAASRPANYLVQRGQGHLVFLEKNVAGVIEDNIRLTPRFQVSVGLRYYFQNYFHDDSNNLAPRFGFAWAPGKNAKTVIRGGSGVFYDRTGPRPIADLLHFNGVNLQRFIVGNPSFPVDPASLITEPTSVVVLDPRARIPYTIQYGSGVERQLTAQSTLSLNWIGTRGIDLFRSIDANAPPPPFYLVRPDAGLGQMRQIQSDGYQKSNALEISFKGRPTHFFTGQAQYTLSKTYNNTSGVAYFPGNSYFPADDWARADTDARHRFNLLGTFALSHFAKVGTAFSVYSGVPVTVTTGNDENGDGISNDRPAGVPRNSLHGPGFVALDLTLSHEFRLFHNRKEGPSINARISGFNILNHTNDVTYIGVITSPFFGQAVAAKPPRQMQMNLQFKF